MKRIDRRPLLKILGLPDKLPKDFRGDFKNVRILDGRGMTVEVCADIRIAPSNGRRHRIFIFCKLCCRDVPIGRYHQHYGSGKCQ